MTMSVLTRLRYLPYRAIRRIGTADISRVFGVEYFELRPTLLPQGFEFVELTTERFRELLTLFPELFNESRLDDLAKKLRQLLRNIQERNTRCVLMGINWRRSRRIQSQR